MQQPMAEWAVFGCHLWAGVTWANDPKLSDTPERRGTCAVGGRAAVEAGAVTRRRVRCSAWLGDGAISDDSSMRRCLKAGLAACLQATTRHPLG